MENLAKSRALEPTLGSASSPASRRAVVQLARLPPEIKENRLVCCAVWDLGNLVRCVLVAGASANARCGESNTPVLCVAAHKGSGRALKALLTGGADVRLVDENGDTALHCAARNGDTDCIALLLAAGASLEAKGVSAFRELNDVLRLLRFPHLQHFERTPLGVAAFEGHSEAVALLLEHGASANAQDRLSNTPMVDATAGQHIRCVELLLPHSDLTILSKQGVNAFHASVSTASYDCFKLLLPRMADLDVRTGPDTIAEAGEASPSDQTATHIACMKGQHKMLEKLLRRGASRTARDSKQYRPLHYAAFTGQLSCIVQLIGHPEAYKMAPADINAADANGWTPLHFAAGYGLDECCGLLIAAGARLDARSRDYLTPLMVAQQEHPSNTALLDLLAGHGPAHLPGTICDRCGCPEDPASHLMPCSGCQVARYCSIACQHAAWAAHETECGRLKAEREHNARVHIFQ